MILILSHCPRGGLDGAYYAREGDKRDEGRTDLYFETQQNAAELFKSIMEFFGTFVNRITTSLAKSEADLAIRKANGVQPSITLFGRNHTYAAAHILIASLSQPRRPNTWLLPTWYTSR